MATVSTTTTTRRGTNYGSTCATIKSMRNEIAFVKMPRRWRCRSKVDCKAEVMMTPCEKASKFAPPYSREHVMVMHVAAYCNARGEEHFPFHVVMMREIVTDTRHNLCQVAEQECVAYLGIKTGGIASMASGVGKWWKFISRRKRVHVFCKGGEKKGRGERGG